MTAPLKVWQYDLPSINGEGWAKILIREDGLFAAVSDWGDVAHIWGATGPGDVRKFFLRIEKDPGYFAIKFESGRRQHIDGDASISALKRELLSYRRKRELTREQAAEDWEKFQEHGDDYEGLIRENWNFTEEPWRYSVNETSQSYWFCKHVGPRLTKAIREQIEEEGRSKFETPSNNPVTSADLAEALRNVLRDYNTEELELLARFDSQQEDERRRVSELESVAKAALKTLQSWDSWSGDVGTLTLSMLQYLEENLEQLRAALAAAGYARETEGANG